MNTKWYIQLYVIPFNNNYWASQSTKLCTCNNIHYILAQNVNVEIVKKLLALQQYESIISYCCNANNNCFTCIYEISEEKLFLLNFSFHEQINSYISKNIIFEGDNIQEGIMIW